MQKCFLSYDGGNDEGFGNLEKCETSSGTEVPVEALLDNAAFVEAVTPLVTSARPPIMRPEPAGLPTLIRDYLEMEVPIILVSLLLGRGYGTGEYELYGRAVADLDAMTITDDPNAPYPHSPSE